MSIRKLRHRAKIRNTISAHKIQRHKRYAKYMMGWWKTNSPHFGWEPNPEGTNPFFNMGI